MVPFLSMSSLPELSFSVQFPCSRIFFSFIPQKIFPPFILNCPLNKSMPFFIYFSLPFYLLSPHTVSTISLLMIPSLILHILECLILDINPWESPSPWIQFCIFFWMKPPLQFSIDLKSSPVTGLEWPRGFQEVKVPKFHDNGTGWR